MSEPRPFPQDLLIRGALVISPARQEIADVLVSGGQIAAVGPPGAIRSADVVIDAHGLTLLPGLVDAHVHVRDPGLDYKEDIGSVTRAAAAGGVTSIVVMPFDRPIASSSTALEANRDHLQGRALVDFAMAGAIGPRNVAEIIRLAETGACSVEVMLADAPEEVGLPIPAELERLLVTAHDAGILVGIYCDNGQEATAARDRLVDAGRRDLAAFMDSRSADAEAAAAATACAAALRTGAAVHLRQLSTAAAIAVARAAQDGSADISVEVTPHHLVLNADDALARGLKVLPPMRSSGDRAALRRALADGSIDVVASDHAPHAAAEKEQRNIWDVPAGLPGIQTMLSVLFKVLGAQAAPLIARVCSETPARRFGLAAKGGIEPGRDADLVLVDTGASWLVEPSALYSRGAGVPFSGDRLPGVVHTTILRGRIVYQDGRFPGPPDGRWLRPQRVAIGAGPAGLALQLGATT